MKLHFKIDLYEFDSPSLTGSHFIEFHNVSDHVDWNVNEEDCISLDIDGVNREIDIWDSHGGGASYTTHFDELSTNGRWIEFDANINDGLSELPYFITENIIQVTPVGDSVLVWLYTQNSENDVLSKSLTFVNIIAGQFNSAFNLKNPVLDLHITDSGNIACNYIYIPSLSRYYYVESVDVISANYIRYKLREDVLMTWQSLIRQQNAFVVRSYSDSNNYIVDERLPLKSIKTITYFTPTPTGTGNQVNITLKGNFTTEYNFLVSTYNDVAYTKTSVNAPDTNLPSISSVQPVYQSTYFLTNALVTSFMKALINEDSMVSAVNTIMFLPFDPDTAFSNSNINSLMIGLPSSKALCDDDKFHYLYDIPSGVSVRNVHRTSYGTSPYLVLADFSFPNLSDEWYNREPYTYYELYVAFVGWIKVDISQLNNKRILIYYTLDLQTGNATAYVYNKTDGKIIYSCGCQLGVKLDILSSNALELTREKQANQLNTLIGLLASAVSVGAGAVTENPVAVAGGVLSAGKTIANAVNKDRMMFERAQVTYGSSDGGLHSNLATMLRITKHLDVLTSTEEDIFREMQGYPSNKYNLLSNFSGYTEVGEIHFDPKNNLISQDEISEIVTLLKDGVIL